MINQFTIEHPGSPPRQSLPIDTLVSNAIQLMEAGHELVVLASPGSGKTTRIPPALLTAGFAQDKEILVLVPRRLAAKFAARRVAWEMGEEVGETVGYQFRFENVAGRKTRLKFVTEGILLRRLIGDPTLKNTACVVLDEFHERHLNTDVAISMLKTLQSSSCPDLRLAVMSATLDPKPLLAFLPKAELLALDARQYPVEIIYRDDKVTPSRGYGATGFMLADKVLSAVRSLKLQRGKAGQDILVFLPGMAEILKCAVKLRQTLHATDFLILPLHGDLPKDEQDRVFKPCDRIKVILATNIAESSLTVEGVANVIDSGLHRQASYSWWSGVPSLTTKPISKASATQRAGRAGRTSPGTCVRLYAKADFDARPVADMPEIRRADLAQTVLELKACGRERLSEFPWFEAPPAELIDAAITLLSRLGALGGRNLDAPLTELGKSMTRLPLHPRLSRMLLAAHDAGVTREASRLAAYLSEGCCRELDILDELTRHDTPPNVVRVEQHLLAILPGKSADGATAASVARCLLAGFPDRVAKKRPPQRHGAQNALLQTTAELLFSFGGSGTVTARGAVVTHEYFAVLDVRETRTAKTSRDRVQVSALCPIEPEWLLETAGGDVTETDVVAWNENRRAVFSIARLAYGEITLTETLADPPDTPATTLVLLKSVCGLDAAKLISMTPTDLFDALARVTDPAPLAELLARLVILRAHGGLADIPDFTAPGAINGLVALMPGLSRADDISGEKLAETIRARLHPAQVAKMEHDTPAFLTLPSGRRAKIIYAWGQAPRVESWLQDFWGLSEAPKICCGRVSLSVHLLAPNRRPVQVTTDLASFWKNTYPGLRQQLSRRYPRHKWP